MSSWHMAEGGGRGGEVWRTSDVPSIQRHVGLGHCEGKYIEQWRWKSPVRFSPKTRRFAQNPP